jgi:hypothetical protein
MRSQHLIAIALAFAAGFGVKQLFFSPSTAKANVDAVVKGASIDLSKMPVDAELPVHKMHDMTFVFSEAH